MKQNISLFIFVFLLSSMSLGTTIWLPSILSDNMVLQADTNAPIWGKAQPNSQITISCPWNKKGIVTTVQSDDKGKWAANIRTPKKAKQGIITITCGKDIRTISNVLVGQVWVCSGQSNMGWPVIKSKDAEEELLKAKNRNIRLFTVKKSTANEPQEDCFGQWVECDPETVEQFSAVGYYFGKSLYSELHRPIGLINSSYGGTPAQAWTSKDAFENNSNLKEYLAVDANNEANKEIFQNQYNIELKEWKNEVMKAVASGKTAPGKPKEPLELRDNRKCGRLFNAMINPLIPFAIKGAIWYQGESNASNAVGYRTLFPAMIADWRKIWNQGDFPFYFAQLSNYGKVSPQDNWPLIREAQTMTLALPNTGMAVTMDAGDFNTVHPEDKQIVGTRLAFWALAKNYGYKKLTYSGPLYKGMKIEGDKIRIFFDYADGGLKAPKKETLKGFEIAGNDKKFLPANVKIDKQTILVWSEDIKNPNAVRYGWANWMPCNLYNMKNLPASPFRTDNE
ncbi:MAG: sialate O-acetylesterase [Phycisphaerales bacterium]